MRRAHVETRRITEGYLKDWGSKEMCKIYIRIFSPDNILINFNYSSHIT